MATSLKHAIEEDTDTFLGLEPDEEVAEQLRVTEAWYGDLVLRLPNGMEFRVQVIRTK